MTFKRNIIAFFVIGIVGSLSHFVYEWSGQNLFVGCFFPINESVWEHLKLVFYPCILYFFAEYFTLKEKNKGYIPSSILSLYYGMGTVVVLYYTFTGIIGKNIDFLNIIFYLVGIIAVLCKRRKLYYSEKLNFSLAVNFSYALAIITAILFSAWSYFPPNLSIFKPPHHP